MAPEWDYTHAKPDGQTVFVFRDTDHTNEKNAEAVLSELCGMVERRFFNVVFTEGVEGIYTPDFPFRSEEELRRTLIQKRGRCAPIEIFAYRQRTKIEGSELFIYGVDSDELREEQIKLSKRVIELGKIMDQGRLTPQQAIEMDYLMGPRTRELTDKRSAFSADMIASTMNGLPTAGLVYGDGHFQDIVDQLTARGVGYVSFFPGKSEVDPELVKRHIDRM